MYGNNSRKITCDYYIDDKAVLPQLLNVMLAEVCINTMISEYYGAAEPPVRCGDPRNNQ